MLKFRQICPLLKKSGFLVLFICCFAQHIAAYHFEGAEILYKYDGGSTYTVSVIVYTDCNGIPLSATSFNITDGSTTKTYTPNLCCTTVYDIDVASGMCTRCSNTSCTFLFGIQMMTFTSNVDVSVFSGCNLTISWSVCCANGAITTLSPNNLYVETRLNRCIKDHNSPVFQEYPLFWVNNGKPVDRFQTVSPGDRNDSVSYRLVYPLMGAANPYQYNKPYDYNHFLIYSGTAIDDGKPQGFHYDNYSGALNFTPSKTDVSLMAIEADEYAKDNNGKYYLSGTSLRLNQISSVDLVATNSNPVIKAIQDFPNDSVYTCSGISLTFDIRTFDPDAKDTVFLSAINETGGTLNFSTGTTPKATFTWTPGNKDVSTKPYHIIISAKDSKRPVGAYVQRRFYIFVTDSTQALKITHSDSGCAKYYFTAPSDTTLHLQYKWLTDNVMIGSKQSITYTFPYNGKHIIDLQVTNKAGCVRHFYDSVQINILPNIKAGSGAEICPGNAATLTASGGTNLTWSPSSGLSAGTGAKIFASPSLSTTYFVTGRDKNGCKAIDSVTVVVDNFKIKVQTDSSFCIHTFAYIPAYTYKAQKYKWTNTAGKQLSDSAGLALILNADLNYSLMVTDSLGCAANKKGIIRAINPVADAGKDASICYGDSIRLHGSGGKYIKWLSANGLKYGSLSPDPYVSPTQTQKYILVVTDSSGCTATDTVKVSVANIQHITLSPATICQGDSVRLFAYGGIKYSWSPGIFVSNPNTPSPFFYPPLSTKFSVRICDSDCSCFVTDTVTIKVIPFKKPGAGAAVEICEGTSAEIGTNAENGYSYLWFSKPGGFTSHYALNTVSPSSTTWYYVNGKNSDNTCSAMDSVKITVLPSIHSDYTGPDAVCQGDTVFYQANSNNPDQIYAWHFPEGHLVFQGKNYLDMAWDSIGQGELKLIESWQGRCADSVSKFIKIIARPQPKITAEKNICLGQQASFADSGKNASQYTWQFGDNYGSKLKNPQHLYASPGAYLVSLTSSNGLCQVTDTLSIAVHIPPILHPLVSHIGFREYIFENKDSTGITGQWNTGDGNQLKSNRIQHAFADTGSYQIKFIWQDAWGCNGIFDTLIYITDTLTPVYSDTFWVSPNPFRNVLTVHSILSQPGPVQIRMFDAIGRLTGEKEFLTITAGPHNYPISGNSPLLRPGLYLLTCTSGKITRFFKVMKE